MLRFLFVVAMIFGSGKSDAFEIPTNQINLNTQGIATLEVKNIKGDSPC